MSKSKINQWSKALLEKLFKKAANEFVKEIKKETKGKHEKEGDVESKSHSWRLCPIGEHWVTDHPLWVPPTDTRPGYQTTRDGHCAANPARRRARIIKDYLTAEEMQMMADKYFANLSGPPASGKLPEYAAGADNFDQFIRGWTKYWNDIFKPNEPLDPDLVKALIATESDFILKPTAPSAGIAGKAHGLIQLTDQAIEALGNPKGELLNQLVKISTEDTSDPNLSIGAAVRWLFRKRELASQRLKRQASWREAIAEYKSYLSDMVSGKDPNPKQMKKFDDIYERLKK